MRKTYFATFIVLHVMSAALLAEPMSIVSRQSTVGVTIKYQSLTDPTPTFGSASQQTILPGTWTNDAMLDSSSAHQDSIALPGVITGIFEAHANTASTEFGETYAYSSMISVFDLVEPQDAFISGIATTVDNSASQISRGEVRLTGPATSFTYSAGMNVLNQPFSFYAYLRPGQYTLEVLSSGNGSVIESAHSTVNVSLIVSPEPGSICLLIFPFLRRRRI